MLTLNDPLFYFLNVSNSALDSNNYSYYLWYSLFKLMNYYFHESTSYDNKIIFSLYCETSVYVKSLAL